MRFSHVIGLAASIVLGSACGASAQDVVRVGNLKLAHFGAISYINQIASTCGLKIEEKIFAKGLDIMQAMIAGELDVGATASESVTSARASGASVYVVGGFAKGGARLLVKPDGGMKTVADLKGKKVGVTRGGIQEILLAAVLGEAGITSSDQPGKDVQLVYLNWPDLNQALLQKQLDAVMQTEPQGSQAISAGFGVEIMKPYNTPIGSPLRTLVMTEKFYNEKKPAAQKFMTCFLKATKTFMDEPATAEKFVRETMFKGQLSVEDFQAAIGNAPYAFDMSTEHMQITADTMFKYGIGKMQKAPVASDFVKLDLLDAAKKELGLK
jgi:NitT/TauT family transport system substrate-binding protein